LRYDLIIHDVNVVTSSDVFYGSVLARDGKTAALVRQELIGDIEAAEVIDGSGCYLLPGMVDVHTHIDEQWADVDFDMSPYRPVNDDLASATKAAAAGGITTVTLMPASFPVVNTAEKLLQRRDYCLGKCYVDFALLGGAGVEMLDTIVSQAEAGAVGYKSYFRQFTSARKGLVNETSGDVFLTMEKVREAGRPVGIHSEDAFLSRVLTEKLRRKGRTDPSAWLESRPESVEISSTVVLLEAAKLSGAPFHLVHMSSPRAVELAIQWREWGTDVSIETCPHYLLFSNEDMAEWGPYLKVAPPLRTRSSMDRLWDQLNDGLIDILATDHAPGYEKERKIGEKDIFALGGGMPALETTMPAMLGKVFSGKLSLSRLVQISAENPARRFGMYPQKGTITVGSDADYILVDPDREWELKVEDMYSLGREAGRPYDGMHGKGAITHTVLGGKVVYRNGEITGSPAAGSWVRPR